MKTAQQLTGPSPKPTNHVCEIINYKMHKLSSDNNKEKKLELGRNTTGGWGIDRVKIPG